MGLKELTVVNSRRIYTSLPSNNYQLWMIEMKKYYYSKFVYSNVMSYSPVPIIQSSAFKCTSVEILQPIQKRLPPPESAFDLELDHNLLQSTNGPTDDHGSSTNNGDYDGSDVIEDSVIMEEIYGEFDSKFKAAVRQSNEKLCELQLEFNEMVKLHHEFREKFAPNDTKNKNDHQIVLMKIKKIERILNVIGLKLDNSAQDKSKWQNDTTSRVNKKLQAFSMEIKLNHEMICLQNQLLVRIANELKLQADESNKCEQNIKRILAQQSEKFDTILNDVLSRKLAEMAESTFIKKEELYTTVIVSLAIIIVFIFF